MIPKDIQTNRLNLSYLRHENAEEIFFGYASKPEATRYVSWTTHRSIEDTRNFIRLSLLGWSVGREYNFVIRDRRENRFVGSFGMIHEEGIVQFGYIINPSQWGQGYATEVCCRMMSLLNALPGITRIWTIVDPENVRSIRVLKKSGLVEDERLRKKIRFVNQGNTIKECLTFVFPLARHREFQPEVSLVSAAGIPARTPRS